MMVRGWDSNDRFSHGKLFFRCFLTYPQSLPEGILLLLRRRGRLPLRPVTWKYTKKERTHTHGEMNENKGWMSYTDAFMED